MSHVAEAGLSDCHKELTQGPVKEDSNGFPLELPSMDNEAFAVFPDHHEYETTNSVSEAAENTSNTQTCSIAYI